MSSTRQTLSDQPIKVEDHLEDKNTEVLMDSARKRARRDSSASERKADAPSGDIEEGTPVLSSIDPHPPLTSHTHADYEYLQRLLQESYLFREAVIEQNRSLASQLRTNRRELHRLRSFVDFAANKLHEQATRRFCSIDSDTASEDELEVSKSDDEE
ncbi:hypothetical protein B0H12DRAFT_1229090 [Mycena haematopus]|nr:hypothetical protein B0H12DRAFT_1229090 [Mycena haematopus]